MKRYEESEPALISVYFLFLLCLSEVKYCWWKSGKGDKTVNLFYCISQEAIRSPGIQQSTWSKKDSRIRVFVMC